MIDYGARKTRTEVLRAEGRIRMIYRQAQKDIEKKLETFEKRHAARAEKYRQMVKDGKITQADYEAWMRGQVFQGEQWKAKKESIQQVLYNADNAALNVIDKGKLGVFTENANYVGYQLDHGARIDSGFNLYNEQAVARLIKDRPALLKKGVNKPKAFSWYNTLINNAVTQGIILGEGIPAIAKRIGETTGEQTKNAMVRNARTAMVSAQNGGRLEGLMQQKALGIDVKKRWHATFDARTRDAHGELDGQIKELEEPFTNSLGKLMFPGDPTGAAGNVYNCRCRMDGYYPEYDFGDVRRDNETGEVVGNLSYAEWKESKLSRALTDNANGDIMLSDSNRNRHRITQESVDSVPQFDEFDSQVTNEAVCKACKEILGDLFNESSDVEETISLPLSKLDEYLHNRLNMDGLKVKGGTGDEAGKVKFVDLREPYIALHNHPSNDTFSFNDVDKLGQYPYCMGIVVIGNNGRNAYSLIKTDSFDYIGFLKYTLDVDQGKTRYKPHDKDIEELKVYGLKYIPRRL